MLPPMMARYTPEHALRRPCRRRLPAARRHAAALRSQLHDLPQRPASYEGGALRIQLGTRDLRFKGAPGTAIVYPSDMLHEVERVTAGERLVAITFIQSRIADNVRREMLYELNEVAALEGLGMGPENFARLQLVQANLLRRWGDRP